MISTRAPEIVVVADAQALAEAAAKRLLARVLRAQSRAAVCLSGGATPQGLYRLLAREPYRSDLPWDRVHWFITDERFVPADDHLSNIAMARRIFLDGSDTPSANIHPIATNAGRPDEAARLYQAELQRFYGGDCLDSSRPLFDLVLMGIGADGHTASLFQNSAAIDETQRWVVSIEKPGLAPFVPRVTLTFPALGSTRELLFLVSGKEKRGVLARLLAGEDLPANRVRSDGDFVWLVDRAALPTSLHAGAKPTRSLP